MSLSHTISVAFLPDHVNVWRGLWQGSIAINLVRYYFYLKASWSPTRTSNYDIHVLQSLHINSITYYRQNFSVILKTFPIRFWTHSMKKKLNETASSLRISNNIDKIILYNYPIKLRIYTKLQPRFFPQDTNARSK